MVYEPGSLDKKLGVVAEIKPTEKTLHFRNLSEIRANLTGPQYLVKPYIERDTVAVWFGESGAYKSFIAIDLGLCVAHGVDYHGLKVRKGAVFYICGEGHGGMGRRIEAWHIAGKIHTDAPFFVSQVPAQILDTGNAEAVREEISSICSAHNQSPALIVIDTLSTNLGDGDESSNTDISKFLVRINATIRQSFNAAVIVVHHVGHGDKERERGAYAIRANADSRVLIKREPGFRCSIHCLKMKDGKEFDPVAFQAHVVTIPGVYDNYGEGVTSLSLSRVDYVPEGDQRKLSPQKAQALGVLEEMYREKGDNMEQRGKKRADANVFLFEWQDKLQACKIIKDYKQARTYIKNALLKEGVVTIEGKFIYLASMAEKK